MAPIVDGIETQYSQQIVVKRIDANKGNGPSIMSQLRIPGHPTTLIFDSVGKETKRFVGPQSRERVEAALNVVLAE